MKDRKADRTRTSICLVGRKSGTKPVCERDSFFVGSVIWKVLEYLIVKTIRSVGFDRSVQRCSGAAAQSSSATRLVF